MIPRGVNPVCHRMPIIVPAYSAAQKPSRKRKSDGNGSGKPRKKKSTGEKGCVVEDSEQCSELVQCDVNEDSNDVNADSEQTCVKPSRRKKTKSSKVERGKGSRRLVENTGTVSIPDEDNPDTNADSEQPGVKPSRRKKTTSSKTERVKGSRHLVENTDTISIPDEYDSDTIADSEQPCVKPSRRKKTKLRRLVDDTGTFSVPEDVSAAMRKRSTDSLAEKLRSPFLQVIEAGDADDFAGELERPVEVVHVVEVHDPGVCDTSSPPLGDLSCSEKNHNVVQTHSNAGNCEEMKNFVDKSSSFDTRSCTVDLHTDVITSPTCRSVVPTPPTFEETSAALQAIEEAGRVSPVDIMELVERWKHGQTEQLVDAPHDAVSDDDLPVFNIRSKPRQEVLNGEMVKCDLRNLENGHNESRMDHTEQHARLSTVQSISRVQKHLQDMEKTSVQMDQKKGYLDCEVDEDVLRRNVSSTDPAWFENDEDFELPYGEAEYNQISKNTLSKIPKTPDRHVPQSEDMELRGNKGAEESEEKSGFLHPTNVSLRDLHASTELPDSITLLDKKLPRDKISHPVDEFSQFNDTNDDEFLAAAVATPMITDRRHTFPRSSANVSVVKTADDSQITFTQALACVHDSLDVTRLCTESPRIHATFGKVDDGMDKSMKIDEPQFDLGFDLSDDDNDDDDDDDDIIPPSPPASSSSKSGVRLVGRSNSLITVSRQNSCGSTRTFGHQTDRPVDDEDVDCVSTRGSGLVSKESDVRNTSVSDRRNSVEHQSSKGGSSVLVVTGVMQSGTVATEQKSEEHAPMTQSNTVAMEQKWRDRAHWSEWSLMAMGQKSMGLTPASGSNTAAMDQKSGDQLRSMQLTTVELEKKSRQQAVSKPNVMAQYQNSTYPAHASQVAVIRPCVRSLATPTAPAGQSEITSPPAALSSSTPIKLSLEEKSGEFVLKVIKVIININDY